MRTSIFILSIIAGLAITSLGMAMNEKAPAKEPAGEEVPREGAMTLEHMHEILERLDEEAARSGGSWQITIADVPVIIVTDNDHNRMRILVAIRKSDALTPEELMRIMQANFDSALDARYAIGQGILWSTFIHPLSTLHDQQFIAAIGQTVNLAQTYGSSYSSGLLLYGGGDSSAIEQRELIDRLLKQGQPT